MVASSVRALIKWKKGKAIYLMPIIGRYHKKRGHGTGITRKKMKDEWGL
jgi:hypothetical protein